jgi:hypothetical protein
MSRFLTWARTHWGDTLLVTLLLFVIFLNVKPGKFILGNDTYAPDLNPGLSITRYLTSPAWRGYRALGVPSDSEQADIVRTVVYYAFSYVLPKWALSQIYVFGAFFLAGWGMSQFAKSLWHGRVEDRETVGFVAGLLYMSSAVAAWMFASPLYPFLGSFAFLPFVLWRLLRVFRKPVAGNYVWLFISMLLIGTTAMVPTTFIVEAGIIFYLLLFGLMTTDRHKARITILSFVIIIGSQLFWIVPFVSYVKTNAGVLAQSYINRGLTPNLVENEVKYSTFFNVPRFYFAWTDTVNDDGTPQYPFAVWYRTSPVAAVMSFIPLVLAIIGIVYGVKRKDRSLVLLIPLFIGGWILLTGVNPPFGFIFIWFQKHIPLFQQVFRWQSSKLFPMMAIPLAVLGAYGAVGLSQILKKHIRLITGIILITSVIFIRHYFSGHLINATNVMHVPEEYYALAGYLEKNDPDSRIYLAPESNTLYFRSYSWGFFGSSFDNYLFPNPVIEKAMTTASPESESAQRVIEHAYNARQPDTFVRALRLYKTPLVLYDKNATRLHNGYFYEPDAYTSVIKNNPDLTLIWQQGNLYLYRLQGPAEITGPFISIYPFHDWEHLSTVLTNASIPAEQYVAAPNTTGVIYPFALSYDSFSLAENGLTGITTYRGPQAQFNISYTGQTDDVPTSIIFDPDRYILTGKSANPSLEVNGTQVSLPAGGKTDTFRISPRARFISVSGTVIDLHTHNSVVVKPSLAQLDRSIIQWASDPAVIPVGKREAKQISYPVSQDGIIEWIATLVSPVPQDMNICLYSEYRKRCINQDRGLTVSAAQISVDIIAGETIDKGDRVTVYVDALGTAPVTSTSELRIYPSLGSLAVQSSAAHSGGSESVTLKDGDRITLNIPRITGNTSYAFTRSSALTPAISHNTCTDTIRPEYSGDIIFTDTACSESISVNLPLMQPTPDSLGMIMWDGTNTAGIPATIDLYRDKSGYHHYEEYLLYANSGASLAFVPLPTGVQTYKLDVFSYGIGPRPSVNQLHALMFQIIPKYWYSMKLVPVSQSVQTSVISINQAFHPLWTLPSDPSAMPVRINGWEQGWVVENPTVTQSDVVFSPNRWVFIGYGVTLLMGACLLLWQTATRARKSRM